MINLDESQLKDTLPGNIKSDPHIQSFCYAFDKQVKKLLNKAKKLSIWSNLHEVDENLLDYLAVELRTQYYSILLDISVKRALIENTLIWYRKAGTVAAVEELMRTTFGDGTIKEWYEYDGLPHHFKIVIENSTTVDTNAEVFLAMLDSIKRKSAKLDTIEVISDGYMNLKIGIISREYTRNIV